MKSFSKNVSIIAVVAALLTGQTLSLAYNDAPADEAVSVFGSEHSDLYMDIIDDYDDVENAPDMPEDDLCENVVENFDVGTENDNEQVESAADLNGSHDGETATKYVSFVANSYQRGKLMTAEEKEAELSAITDSSTMEVIEYIHQQILGMAPEINLERFNIKADKLHVCYQALMNNYPDMYFVDIQYLYTMFMDGTVEYLDPQYTMTVTELRDTQDKIDQEVDNILKEIKPDMNRFDKIAAVNNYFCSHYTYDYEHLNNNTGYVRHYMIPAIFIDKSAVCQGYSLAFKYIMDLLEIPCTTAQSSEMAHLWNLVQAKEDSENWYNIDVTWDSIYYGEYGMSPYTFFLKSDSRFQNMHNVSGFNTSQDHYNYIPDGWALDENYDDTVLNNAGTEPFYSNGYWYFGKSKYDWGSPVTIYRYDTSTGTYEAVLSISDEWAIAAGVYSGYYFNSAAVYKKKIYYNDSLNVYVYDPALNKSEIFLKEPEGVVKGKTPIWEIRIEGNDLIYVTAPDYPGNGAAASEHSAVVGTDPIKYIDSVTLNNGSVSVSTTSASGADKLVVSYYDAENRFISCKITDYKEGVRSEVPAPVNAKSVSVFAVKMQKGGIVPIGFAEKKSL